MAILAKRHLLMRAGRYLSSLVLFTMNTHPLLLKATRVGAVAALALVASLFAFALTASVQQAHAATQGSSATTTATVTILKYVGGSQATTVNTGGASFNFASSWNDQGGSGQGNGTFSLGSGNSYQATSIALNASSSYAVHEVTSDTVSSSNTLPAGAQCQAGMWRLVGYRTGSSVANAQAATLSTSSPALSNIHSNQYVIAVNENCNSTNGGGNAPTLTLVKHAMGGNGSFSFSVNGAGSTTLATANGWATSSAMMLDTGSSTVAEAAKAGWNMTGVSCMKGGQATGMPGGAGAVVVSASSSDAITCTFTNMNTATSTGTTTDAVLHVDSIDAQKTIAIANSTYEDGWRYLFHVTAPNNEHNLAMRFSDWFVSSTSSSTIPVAGNMRISSPQASSTAPITLTGPNAYSTPALVMTSDLDPSKPGRQVDVLVEVKIPTGTSNETYTTNYGVRTLP